MEQEKEYNDFIALGRKYYPKQDNRGITNFNSKVLANVYPKKKGILDSYGVTKCELFALIMLEGFFSEWIQRPLVFGLKTNSFIERCISYFDSLLSKTPKTSSIVLYRQDHVNSVEDYRELQNKGKHYIGSSFLTASTDDFDTSRSVKLVISPKLDGKTKAHDVYRIMNHGEDINGAKPENQVNFERNAEFEIMGIDEKQNIPVVYLNEI